MIIHIEETKACPNVVCHPYLVFSSPKVLRWLTYFCFWKSSTLWKNNLIKNNRNQIIVDIFLSRREKEQRKGNQSRWTNISHHYYPYRSVDAYTDTFRMISDWKRNHSVSKLIFIFFDSSFSLYIDWERERQYWSVNWSFTQTKDNWIFAFD